MCAFSARCTRAIHIMGTRGQIRGIEGDPGDIKVTGFMLPREERRITIEVTGGHAGGDIGIMEAFCAYIRGDYTGNEISDVRISAENHMVSFAAEESRLSGGKVIKL